MFKVGNKVKLTDLGLEYPNYVSWFVGNCNQFADKFNENKGCCIPEEYKYDIFTIVHIAKHSQFERTTLCAIQHMKTGRIYLFDEKALELAQTNPKKEFNVGDRVKLLEDTNYEYNDDWFLNNAPTFAGKFAYKIKKIPKEPMYSIIAEDEDGFFYAIQEVDKPLERVYLTDKLSIQLDEFYIGDIVTVTKPEKGYIRYTEWFKHYAPELGYNFCFSKNIPKNNDKYKILKKGKHLILSNTMLYAIQQANNEIYLIEEDGIKPVN